MPSVLTDFRESNQLASCLTSFVDEVDSLLDTRLKVEPLWCVSYSDTGGLGLSNECDSLLALR